MTIHNTEGSYLAHAQGKRHQTNLQRKDQATKDAQQPQAKRSRTGRAKIGWPAYQVKKTRTDDAGRVLTFSIHYPEIEEGIQPRHRFMSAFEQKKEVPDRRFTYLLFAADPYETIAFKVPSDEVEHEQERGVKADWNKEKAMYTLEFHYKNTPPAGWGVGLTPTSS
eukprot:Hpha_TRINITY_DN15983_c2_g1::TRINITY_DN15983_c2_g1_i1::g.70481::m.70481/K12826/SF3A2, SAP62; splicing factor 3A subunit 2